MTNDALHALVDAFGSKAALARAAGVRPSAVSNWRHRGVPAGRLLALARVAQAMGRPLDIGALTGLREAA